MKEDMSLKERNTWWKKAISKHAISNSNKPKSPKGNRWAVPTDIKDYAPAKKKGGADARGRRSR